eukprot:7994081-Pyramimonas_sp.AAC.1
MQNEDALARRGQRRTIAIATRVCKHVGTSPRFPANSSPYVSNDGHSSSKKTRARSETDPAR